MTLLMSILEQQQQAGTTLLVVLHDRPLVARYFSNVMSMDEGEVNCICLPASSLGSRAP